MPEIKLGEFDRCPACKKKIKNMIENGGKIWVMPNFVVVCPKCGNLFVPKSVLDQVRKQAESPIIQPGMKGMDLVKSN